MERELGQTQEAKGIVRGEKAQFGYGEISAASIKHLVCHLSKLESTQAISQGIPDPLSYNITKDSSFLDIGSGLGKAVMHVAFETQCRAHGIEVLQHRVRCSEKFKERLIEEEDAPTEWKERVTFEQVNAANLDCYTVDGDHATHIFAFSVVFSEHDLRAMCEALNRTKFKALTFNCDADKAEKYGLRDVIQVASFFSHMGGHGTFKSYVYLKVYTIPMPTCETSLLRCLEEGSDASEQDMEDTVESRDPLW